MDAEGFVPTAPPREPIEAGEAISRAQDFGTVGHLYRGIEQGEGARGETRRTFPVPPPR